jgi:hypothetical protein
MKRHGWRLLLPCLLFAGTVSGAPAPVQGPRLRSLDSGTAKLVRAALERSPTVRGLAERIENTDLIVFVRLAFQPAGRTGSTRLLASSSGTRFILVEIDPMAARIDLIPRLGHELQHVLEIAGANDVHDAAGMLVLFGQIGYRAANGNWETDAAVKTGRRVYEDLSRPAPLPTTLAQR